MRNFIHDECVNKRMLKYEKVTHTFNMKRESVFINNVSVERKMYACVNTTQGTKERCFRVDETNVKVERHTFS